MRLPDSARADVLEFIGASPIGDGYLADIIEKLSDRLGADRAAAQNDLKLGV
jgi:hypothetical protein